MATEIVEQELKEYTDKYGPERGLVHLLNNFIFNLPSEDYPHGGYYRKLSFELGVYDITNRETVIRFTPSDMREKESKYHSDLMLNQTQRQFFETIDKVLEELNIPIDEVKRLIKVRFREGKNILYDLYKLTLPAYIKLREMGYTRQDLVA